MPSLIYLTDDGTTHVACPPEENVVNAVNRLMDLGFISAQGKHGDEDRPLLFHPGGLTRADPQDPGLPRTSGCVTIVASIQISWYRIFLRKKANDAHGRARAWRLKFARRAAQWLYDLVVNLDSDECAVDPDVLSFLCGVYGGGLCYRLASERHLLGVLGCRAAAHSTSPVLRLARAKYLGERIDPYDDAPGGIADQLIGLLGGVVRDCPGHFLAHSRLGSAHLEMFKFSPRRPQHHLDAALTHLARARDLRPDHHRNLVALAHVHSFGATTPADLVGLYRTALRAAERQRVGPDASCLLGLATWMHRDRPQCVTSYTEALGLLRDAVRLEPLVNIYTLELCQHLLSLPDGLVRKKHVARKHLDEVHRLCRALVDPLTLSRRKRQRLTAGEQSRAGSFLELTLDTVVDWRKKWTRSISARHARTCCGTRVDGKFCTLSGVLRCKCGDVGARYCSEACQLTHWPAHRLLCRTAEIRRSEEAVARALAASIAAHERLEMCNAVCHANLEKIRAEEAILAEKCARLRLAQMEQSA